MAGRRFEGAVPLSNKPMKRTKADSSRSVSDEPGPRGSPDEQRPPRGPGSATIDQPGRPSPLIGRSFDNRGRCLERRSSGGEDHRLSVAIAVLPDGDLRGLWRRLDAFWANCEEHRSLELHRRSSDSAAAISAVQAVAGEAQRSFGAEIITRAVDLAVAHPRERDGLRSGAGMVTIAGF